MKQVIHTFGRVKNPANKELDELRFSLLVLVAWYCLTKRHLAAHIPSHT